jgi:phosphohistidine swiveling domain-containing protein
MSTYVVPLAACTADMAGDVGGKSVGLGALLRQGIPVPKGFTVTTDAYRETVLTVVDEVASITEAGADDDAVASARLRSLIELLPVPPEVDEAIRAAYLELDPSGEALVAVRSSATAEDLEDASFAGQQDTYLGVRGTDSVVQHVVRCWGSLFTSQAIGYRKRFAVPVTDLAMAVVVQQMVEAEAAGVMMTLDPITGDRSTVFISAAHGIGEGVVKGDVESDSIWVDKESLAVTGSVICQQQQAHRYSADAGGIEIVDLDPEVGDTPAITTAEAVELARFAIAMEEAQGGPRDLEWAVALVGGQRVVRLLQSRPETVWANRESTLPSGPTTLHGDSHPNTTWTTTNVGESIPGVPTPLSWSMWCVAGEFAMRSAFHAIGALSKEEAKLPEDKRDWMLGIFYGRASLSVSMVCEWTARVPATDPIASAEQIFSARPKDYTPRSRRIYYPRVLAKSGLPMFRVKSMVANDRETAETFYAATLAELSSTDEARTLELLEEALALHMRCLSTQTLLTMTVVQPIVDQLLRLASSVGISGEELMAGYGGHDETAAVSDMWAVSRGRLDLDTFLARHGFHAWAEGELSSTSWREDRAHVERLIASYAERGDDADPAIAEKARMDNRVRLEAQFLAALPAVKRPIGRLVLKLAKTFVPPRGVAKGSFVQVLDIVRASARRLGEHYAADGRLDERDDIFYLVLEEIRGGLPPDVRELVTARRAERTTYETMEIPSVFDGIPRPVFIVPEQGEDTILGTGASPGVVEGRARVVTSPDQARVEDGEILVARDTDPSWASLMFLSAGLVADIGGVMSHTAIVARELSLPCVVNTGNASKTLRTGDLIRVNGSNGSIEVLERVAQSA